MPNVYVHREPLMYMRGRLTERGFWIDEFLVSLMRKLCAAVLVTLGTLLF